MRLPFLVPYDLLKSLGVAMVVRAEEAVPVVEVEAKVGAASFVVLSVMGGGVEEAAEGGAEEPAGK